jgi:deoxyribose-phosphate aldolase
VVIKNIEKKIFSLLDLTSLQESDNAVSIAALCQKAQEHLGQVAAVCVYPQFVSEAFSQIRGTSIKVASVANFPHGEDNIDLISASILQSVADGATEIDMVFPYRDYLRGKKSSALGVVSTCKKLLGRDIALKVILETGVIGNLSIIERLSDELIAEGADFLKTSTGKVSVGATIEAAAVMLSSIKKSGSAVGFKAAGGIRTIEQAMQYIGLAEDIMGAEWVTSEHFRIGTSGLHLSAS